MSNRNTVISPDKFAITLQELLSDYELAIDDSLNAPIEKNAKEARSELRATSPVKTGGYAKGWNYTMKTKKKGVFAEIGNKKKPGLVHLLEKGHAKVGGGFVAPRVHVAPVAERTEQSLVRDIKETLGGIQ